MSWTRVFVISLFALGAQAQVYPFPDNSIPTAHYESMSFPSLEQNWGLKDFRQAMDCLERIYQTDKYSLPRYNSPYSKRVFDQLTNTKHLTVLKDAKIPLEDRLDILNNLSKELSRLLVIYMEGIDEYRFGAEMLQAFVFYAHYTSLSLDVVEELQIQLGEKGQALRFIRGKKSMEKKHFDICKQLLDHLVKDEGKFPDGVLETFANSIDSDFLFFYKKNAPEHQLGLKAKIQTAIEQVSNKTIVKQLKAWEKKM